VEARQGDGNGGRCRLGCEEIEDERHIFSDCPYFDKWRQEAGQRLRDALATRFRQTSMDNQAVEEVLNKAESFYSHDKNIWPLGDSQYYLGLVPKLQKWIQEEGLERLARERLIHGIYCDWHNTGVRLAARIFGELQRKATRQWDERREKGHN
jgi:hypothetical protein